MNFLEFYHSIHYFKKSIGQTFLPGGPAGPGGPGGPKKYIKWLIVLNITKNILINFAKMCLHASFLFLLIFFIYKYSENFPNGKKFFDFEIISKRVVSLWISLSMCQVFYKCYGLSLSSTPTFFWWNPSKYISFEIIKKLSTIEWMILHFETRNI